VRRGGLPVTQVAEEVHPGNAGSTADLAGIALEHDGGSSTVAKALVLLLAIIEQQDPVRLSDLANKAALPKSTTHRLLKTLEEFGFVGRRGSLYGAGNKSMDLVRASWTPEQKLLRDRARPFLEALAEAGRPRATVHLGWLEGCNVLYLDKVANQVNDRVPTRVGMLRPATSASLGRVLLAFAEPGVVTAALRDPAARKCVDSIVEPRRLAQEIRSVRTTNLGCSRTQDYSCVAAPILVDGQAIGAISLSLPGALKITPAQVHLLRRTTEQIARLYALTRVAEHPAR
jgi:DNA-binding IclR family transcriptional regulator